MLLEVKNLTQSYLLKKHWYLKKEEIFIFKELNFNLKSGENLIITGESGSGKSTLARILCMLEIPKYGEVLYKGINLCLQNVKQKKELRNKIQYIFQDQKLALNPYKNIKRLLFDVYENFSLKKDENEILYFFDIFGLKKEIFNLKPFNLSGGEAQKIGLIRALILKPEILILDEVTSSLDILNTQKILNFLKNYQQKQKVSYIFITHQQEFFNDFLYKKINL
ncbi:ATP-binding cassette domain-containing protein [Campylobacter sp. 2018MI35]|uniref:ATP-binding cassette domain-containing protein n=2 Tax=Campylobacter TaxID=194 RepID=UPI0019086750|nr:MULTISPECIES: ATP-binding cassette domain-containing protein [unclassified Campylobacter]MBK1971945.1 ATP-binding cassette domain-containing protein [Campylobacter sp. TTU_617]MBK1991512.1 ATP-binding cassette domain-containing protein [Campylobacter sp. 2018MI34]